MDKDRIEASAKAAKGSLHEAIGKIVGSETTQAEGAAAKATGGARDTTGKGKATRRVTTRK